MFGPKRKAGAYTFKEIDPPITQKKYDEYVRTLDNLKNVARPKASKEVMELSHGGDFSENAGYQAAKRRLRSINSNIEELKIRIRKAQIITTSNNTETVQIGHEVTITLDGKEQVYTLLGSTETNPSKGIISINSPIGKAIVGKRIGDIVKVVTSNKIVECRIIEIK